MPENEIPPVIRGDIYFAQEAKHTKNVLTISDLRSIIKEVKELYPEYTWR